MSNTDTLLGAAECLYASLMQYEPAHRFKHQLDIIEKARAAEEPPMETMIDDKDGRVIYTEPYGLSRLLAAGQEIIEDGIRYTVVSCVHNDDGSITTRVREGK